MPRSKTKYCAHCHEAVYNEVAIVCSGSKCGKIHHFGCAGLDQSSFQKLTVQERSAWKCMKCSAGTSVSVKGTSDGPDLDSYIDRCLAPISSGPVDSNMLAEILKILKVIHTEVKDLKKSTEFCCDKIDDFVVTLSELRSETDLLKSKCVKLEMDNLELKGELVSLKRASNDSEQYGRRLNLEIHGIGNLKNESDCTLRDVVGKLADNLGIPEFHDSQVDVIHRVGSSSRRGSRPVLVRFTNRRSRDKWIAARRGGVRVTTGDISLDNLNTPIYINENLTAMNRETFWRARQFARNNGYKYAWYSNDHIYLKKNDNDVAVRVPVLSDIIDVIAGRVSSVDVPAHSL